MQRLLNDMLLIDCKSGWPKVIHKKAPPQRGALLLKPLTKAYNTTLLKSGRTRSVVALKALWHALTGHALE